MALSSSPIPGSSLPTLAFHATSHPGLVRTHNGDAWQHIPLPQGDDLFVVADASDPNKDGHLLSQMALSSLQEYLHRQPPTSPETQLQQALEHVHLALQSTVVQAASTWPGCQLVGIWIDAAHRVALGVSIGQGRIYLFRDMTLMCLSQDPSPTEPMPPHPSEHTNTPSDAPLALGSRADIRALLHQIPPFALHPGDLFLVCTDGLSATVSETDMAQLLAQHRSGALNQTCQHLVFQALQTGGNDNVTVLLMEVPGATPPPLALTQPFPTTMFSATQPYFGQLPMTQEQQILFQEEQVREHRYQRVFLWLTILLCLLLFTYFLTSVGLEKRSSQNKQPNPTQPNPSTSSHKTTVSPPVTRQGQVTPGNPPSQTSAQTTPHSDSQKSPQASKKSPGVPAATKLRSPPVRLDLESLPFAPHLPTDRTEPPRTRHRK